MKPSIIKNRKRQMLIIILWFLIWHLIYKGVAKAVLIPSPYGTFKRLCEMLLEQSFYQDVAYTIYRVCIGILLSFSIGLITAILSYCYLVIQDFLEPLILVIKSTPVMAVIILALLWVHSSQVPILVCFLMCYPVVYTNILTGLRQLDPLLIEMSKVYQVKKIFVIQDIYLPHIMPYIKAALNLSVGLSWKVVIAAEVLAVPAYSMGYQLLSAKVYLETEEVFAWIIVIVALSSLFEKLIESILQIRKKVL